VGWYRIFTASLLPPRLRAELGMPWTARDEAIAARTLPLLRAIQRRTPSRLRYFPDYVEAMQRVNGNDAPRDRVGRLLEKVALRAIEPSATVLEQSRRSA
jgi:uncharacterized protein (DUF2236 family)